MPSVQIRSPPQRQPPAPQAHDLKHRVISCLNKLADRDTLPLAAAELDSIAINLSPENFSPFIACLHDTDAATRSPVRRHCASLLSLLSRSHGDSLSPHLPKMISTVVRRLRDPDSAVRSACALATADMSSSITRQPFSVLSGPLIETLVTDRDVNAQIGAAMCLAAAVEAAPEPETDFLRKTLPMLVKLLKSGGFKAKPALLGAIGSVIGTGGAGSKGVLDWLVSCAVEFLSSEDWAVRKAATEVLGKVAVAEKELAKEFKKECLAALEKRRFDKVKMVRETMNHTLELWKQIPDEEISPPPSQSKSLSDNGSASCFSSATRSSSTDVGSKNLKPKKAFSIIKSSPAFNTLSRNASKRDGSLKCKDRNSRTIPGSKLDEKDELEQKLETFQLEKSGQNVAQEAVGPEETENSKPGIKRMLFSKSREVKVYKFGGLRSGSRVVPCNDEENSDAAKAADEIQKDAENWSLISKQISEIEKQQSNLLDLLQIFIRNSRSGISSLESRVHGLELALDEISHDLAVSSVRIPNRDHREETCCKLPGTEFLSPKFWRKTECQLPCSKPSFPFEMLPKNTGDGAAGKKANADTHKPDSRRVQMNQHQILAVTQTSIQIGNWPRISKMLEKSRCPT